MESPPLCANGCGFFGSAETKNFCSKCYKEHLEESAPKVTSPSYPSPIVSQLIADFTQKTSLVDVSDAAAAEPETVKVKIRCFKCNKKVGLLGFKCRCGDMLFCQQHRYPEKHDCNFDFKTMERKELVKNNPLVKADKLAFRI